MRKLNYYVLCFMCFFVFSTLAMEENPNFTIIRIKMSDMREVIPYLEENNIDPKTVSAYLDFDETVGIKVGDCENKKFIFLPCSDRYRTYKDIFENAFRDSPYNFQMFSLKNALTQKGLEDYYAVLDREGTNLLVAYLLEQNVCHLGVCSGLEISDQKRNVMKEVGLKKDNYIHAPVSKARGICEHLSKMQRAKEEVRVVMLMDNSAEFGIEPFLSEIKDEAIKAGFTQLMIIAIEYTKYTDMVTVEAIKQELAWVQRLLNDSQDHTTDDEEYSSGNDGSSHE